MKLAALCCTYLRPELLGELISCYLQQTYPAGFRELVILDDAGQFMSQKGDGWEIVSVPRRFRSLGEKRNACAALASEDVEGFLIADDDDIYLPHWFAAHAEVLANADWSLPSKVLIETSKSLQEMHTNGLYHASWAYRKSAFKRCGGYHAMNCGEDQDLARRFREMGFVPIDPCEAHPPFFVHRARNSSYHVSRLNDQGYLSLQKESVPVSPIAVRSPIRITSLPIRGVEAKDQLIDTPDVSGRGMRKKEWTEQPVPIVPHVLLACYLTSQHDHHHEKQFPADDTTLLMLAKTAESRRVHTIIFYDGLSDDFVHNSETPYVHFVKVPPPAAISNNDYRFFVYRDWLAAHEYESVWCCDLFDVQVNRRPESILDNRYDLWIGIHRDWTISDSTSAGRWMVGRFQKFFRTVPDCVRDKPILMAGTFGGFFGAVQQFLNRLVKEYVRLSPGDQNYDMALFNLVAYRDLRDLRVWARGAPLHSEFLAYDRSADVCFVHK